MGRESKDIQPPVSEMEIPPQTSLSQQRDIAELSPIEKRDWLKWLKNFNFIKFVIFAMFFIYATNVVLAICAPDADVFLQEPLFEALKVLLFTVSGYVFAKTTEK